MEEDFSERFSNVSLNTKAIDVGHKEQVDQFGNWILEKCEQIDVLVNNAGYFAPGPILEEEDGELERMMNVNVYSAYNLTRLLLPRMITYRSGHIFNMCSVASIRPYDNGGSYGITKYALHGFSVNLREQMKKHNIKVTTIFPGATMSGSWEGSGIDPQRIMEASDIADIVFTSAHLSSRAVIEDIVIRPQLGDV